MRAWHWLAEKDADRTQVWSVEKADTLNILLYEMVDKTATSPATAWTAETYKWYAKSVTVMGAIYLTHMIAVSALASLLIY